MDFCKNHKSTRRKKNREKMTLEERCQKDLGSHEVHRQAANDEAVWWKQKSPQAVGEVIMRRHFAQVSLIEAQ